VQLIEKYGWKPKETLVEDRYWLAKKVTLIGALVNVLLAIFKLIGGYLFRSHALIADGIHSVSDLITDIAVLFASKYGSQSADSDHPYGHQRIETAATLLLAQLLILTGFGLAWDALDIIIKGDPHHTPSWPSLLIALISVLANEILFHYTKHVGKKINSPLLLANAWHHRSDAASSLVVTLGLVGSLIGFLQFDALAALIVGLLIIKMGAGYGWNSIRELVDTGVDENTLDEIKKIILRIPGVEKVHQLRTRMMGADTFIDVHILVCNSISVSEGHYIAQKVHYTLMKKLPQIKDVTIHVDPEDDELYCPSTNLPTRKALHKTFLQKWKEIYSIQDTTLHYLNGQLKITIFCKSLDAKTHKTLEKEIQATLESSPEIQEIIVMEEKILAKRHV
jgi:cation diffusion facilitator family transporter